jgi:hypothetical protein
MIGMKTKMIHKNRMVDTKIGKFLLTIAVNEGDKLNSLQVWKVKMTRQDIKSDFKGKKLRKCLLDKGIAHSFYKEYLWVAPINGCKVDELNLKEMISDYFLKWEKERIQVINNFTSDELWYPVSIILLKDAIHYALRLKLKDQKNFIINGNRVYNRIQIVDRKSYTYTILGISLEKILRWDDDNVCLCPNIVYECYDSLNRRVEDRSIRQRNIFSATFRCNSKLYSERLNSIIKNIFPLEVYLSNKTLKFIYPYYEINKEEKWQGIKIWL